METLYRTGLFIPSPRLWTTLTRFKWWGISQLTSPSKSISGRIVFARHASEIGNDSLAIREYLALYRQRKKLNKSQKLNLATELNIYGYYREACALFGQYIERSYLNRRRLECEFAASKLGQTVTRPRGSQSLRLLCSEFLREGQEALKGSLFYDSLYFADLALFWSHDRDPQAPSLRPRATFLRARAQIGQGHFEAGVASLLSIERLFPNPEEAGWNIAGQEGPNSIFSRTDSCLFMLAMGKAEFGLGHYERAEYWLRRALASPITMGAEELEIFEELWCLLSRCSDELGNEAKVRENFWFAEEKYTRNESMAIVALLWLLQRDPVRATAIARHLANRYPMNRSLYLGLVPFADYARTSTFKQKIAHELQSVQSVTQAGPAVSSLETQSPSLVDSKDAALANSPEQRSGTTAAVLPLKHFRLRKLSWSKRDEFAHLIRRTVDSMCKGLRTNTIPEREAFRFLSETLHVDYPDFTEGKKLTRYDVKNLYYRKVKKGH